MLFSKTQHYQQRGSNERQTNHPLSTLLHMDRILVFDRGRVIEDGTHKELLGKRELYNLSAL